MFDAAIAASIRARTNHVEDFQISLMFAIWEGGKNRKREELSNARQMREIVMIISMYVFSKKNTIRK